MKQWEYCIIEPDYPSDTDTIDALGKEGWELVTVFGNHGYPLLYFKRESKRAHDFPYGRHIANARITKRIKQSDLARTLGISRQMMSYIENSKRIPGLVLQDRIREVLSLGEDWTAQAS